MTQITAHHGLLRDTKLHVDDTGGPGRPVVLIHGWPLSGASWSLQASALTTAGYRVITYDRRGFGRSDKPVGGYTYDGLTKDLNTLVETMELQDATLVGFSMGGGEVARYCSTYGVERLRSVVFASSVTPYMLHTGNNPDGPLLKRQAAHMAASLTTGADAFYDGFMTQFFSVDQELKVSEVQRQAALTLCKQASKEAALATLAAFGSTDFRDDLAKVTIPALVIHGDGDATVPFAGSGKRTHAALAESDLHVIAGGPHGCIVSHADEFNQALLTFFDK